MSHQTGEQPLQSDPGFDVSAAIDAELRGMLAEVGLSPEAVANRPLSFVPPTRLPSLPPDAGDLAVEIEAPISSFPAAPAAAAPLPAYQAPVALAKAEAELPSPEEDQLLEGNGPIPPTLDLRIPKSSFDPENDLLDHDERRATKRYRLRGNVMSVTIDAGTGADEALGRVRDISTGGGFFIETRAPLALGTDVCAEVTISSGQALSFVGRVVRSGEEGFGINVQADDLGQGFLNVAVAVARSSGQSRTVHMHVHPILEGSDAGRIEVELSHRWHQVTLDERNEDLHQRFIDTCLQNKRVDYALARYRALKERSPDEPAIDRYLEQLGKIIGFVAFQKTPEEARRPKVSRTAIALLAILAVLGLLWLLIRMR